MAETTDGATLFSHPGWEDAECARCGSSVVWSACDQCGNEGWLLDDDGAPVTPCAACQGKGGFEWCSSDAEWCDAHPLPGRESVPRGEIEDFIVRKPRTPEAP